MKRKMCYILITLTRHSLLKFIYIYYYKAKHCIWQDANHSYTQHLSINWESENLIIIIRARAKKLRYYEPATGKKVGVVSPESLSILLMHCFLLTTEYVSQITLENKLIEGYCWRRLLHWIYSLYEMSLAIIEQHLIDAC